LWLQVFVHRPTRGAWFQAPGIKLRAPPFFAQLSLSPGWKAKKFPLPLDGGRFPGDSGPVPFPVGPFTCPSKKVSFPQLDIHPPRPGPRINANSAPPSNVRFPERPCRIHGNGTVSGFAHPCFVSHSFEAGFRFQMIARFAKKSVFPPGKCPESLPGPSPRWVVCA